MNDMGIITERIDPLSIVSFLIRKAKKFEAVALNEFENILLDKPEEYEAVRKVFLDAFNNYVRLTIKSIFTDIETDTYVK